MNYFNNNLICSKLDEKFFTLVKKVAKAIVKFYKIKKFKPIILVGNDSRQSSNYLLSLMQPYFLKSNIEIHNLGVCNSSCLAYVTKKYSYPLSIYFTAHNLTSEYNGLEIFNINGEKIKKEDMTCLEELIDKKFNLPFVKFSTIKNKEKLKQDYIFYLKNLKKFNFLCIFDCANGGICEILKNFLPKYKKLNFNPDGDNVNKNSGIENIDELKSICIKKQSIGFCFNSSGECINIVDKKGCILKGNEILFVLSNFFQKANDVLVGKNLDEKLKKYLKNKKRILIETQSLSTYEYMINCNSQLGGDNKGNIILKPFSNSEDGLLIAIIFANILSLSKLSINELLHFYK